MLRKFSEMLKSKPMMLILPDSSKQSRESPFINSLPMVLSSLVPQAQPQLPLLLESLNLPRKKQLNKSQRKPLNKSPRRRKPHHQLLKKRTISWLEDSSIDQLRLYLNLSILSQFILSSFHQLLLNCSRLNNTTIIFSQEIVRPRPGDGMELQEKILGIRLTEYKTFIFSWLADQMRNLININALTDHLIRPPKFTYSLNDLGPGIFDHNSLVYERVDFSVQGRNKNKIQASAWRMKETATRGRNHTKDGNQVLIYLHCNCGSRVEAMQFVHKSLQLGYTFVAYDSQGCGHSQGEYISLGYHEIWDLEAVIRHIDLQLVPNPSIVLWGRSMGAVTSINFLTTPQKYVANVKVAVLDSPFVNLNEVICEIVNKKIGAPKILIDIFLNYLEPIVEEKAGFKISEFDLRSQISKIKCPLILMASKSDGLVPFKHLQEIYDAHQGRKSIFYLNQSHTDHRSAETVSKIFKAINRYFVAEKKTSNQAHCAHKTEDINLQSYRSQFKDLNTYSTKKSCNRKKIELTYPRSTQKLEHNYTDFSTQKTRPCIEPSTESKKKKLSLNHSKSTNRVGAEANIRTTIHLYSKENKQEKKQDRCTPLNLLHQLTEEQMCHKKIVSNFEDMINKENNCGRPIAILDTKRKQNRLANFRDD